LDINIPLCINYYALDHLLNDASIFTKIALPTSIFQSILLLKEERLKNSKVKYTSLQMLYENQLCRRLTDSSRIRKDFTLKEVSLIAVKEFK
jgi:anaerobic ribonucleoside-triphosphate reductase